MANGIASTTTNKTNSIWGDVEQVVGCGRSGETTGLHLQRELAYGGCRKNHLCGSLCSLCASVVNLVMNNFTTETQRTTEFFRQTPIEILQSKQNLRQ